MKKPVQTTLFVLLVPIFCPPMALAHIDLSFFGFGSPSKASEGAAEAASSNSATIVPAPAPSFTSILFGTAVSKPGTESSTDALRPLGSTAGTGMGDSGISGGGIPVSSSSGRLPLPPSPSSAAGRPFANNHPQGEGSTQGQSSNFAPPTVSQPNSARLPVHGSHLPSNMATNPSRLPLLHPANAKPNMNQNSMLDLKGVEGQTKSGSFSWMSPEGQVYDVSYVADVRPPPRGPPGNYQHSTAEQSHYSYSALRPTN